MTDAQRDSRQVLREAKQIAQDYGCFVVEKGSAFLLYRKAKPENVFVGKRTSVHCLRRFVCRVTGFH